MRRANLALETLDIAPPRPGMGPVSGGLWESGADTLSGRIVRQICAALFADELTPGERLGTEASLSQRFGVSRMAIRDSLRSLAAAGILDIRVGQRGGIFVASGNPERLAETLAIQIKLIGVNIEEILDAQIAIEVTAAGLAARNADPSDIAGLKAEITAMEREVELPDAVHARFARLSRIDRRGFAKSRADRAVQGAAAYPDAALFAAHHDGDRVARAGVASRAGRLHRGA